MAVESDTINLNLLDGPGHIRPLAPRGGIVRYLQPKPEVSDRKRLKRERLSPPAALARWLDLHNDWERDIYWRSIEKYISPTSLPNILLEHLHRSKYPAVSLRSSKVISYANISLELCRCSTIFQ